jgi:hypothetical protein
MKIHVVKSAKNNTKTYAACPMLVDLPPDGDAPKSKQQ